MTSGDLARLYDSHAPALFAFLLNFTRDESDTRDVLQDVFARLAERPSQLEGVRDVRGYLIRTAHHRAVDRMRRRDARDRAHAASGEERIDLFAPATDADEEMVRGQLAEALGALPPDQRAVIQLKLWEGWTFDAIAEALGIPMNTAASRYRYGMDKLRARLRPLYDEMR